jgi:hypothetical protein
MNATLAEKAMATLDEDLKTNRDLVNDAGTVISKCKKDLAEMEKASPMVLIVSSKKLGHQRYHGGDYNGKSILEIVRNSKQVCGKIQTLLLEGGKSGARKYRIMQKVQGFEKILGCMDAAFSKFAINEPTEDEMMLAREACAAVNYEWRKEGYKMTLKAHICEDHLAGINKDCGGLGGMDESFVEQYHQVGTRADERTCNVPDIECSSMCALKHEAIVANPQVRAKFAEVKNNECKKEVHGRVYRYRASQIGTGEVG